MSDPQAEMHMTIRQVSALLCGVSPAGWHRAESYAHRYAAAVSRRWGGPLTVGPRQGEPGVLQVRLPVSVGCSDYHRDITSWILTGGTEMPDPEHYDARGALLHRSGGSGSASGPVTAREVRDDLGR